MVFNISDSSQLRENVIERRDIGALGMALHRLIELLRITEQYDGLCRLCESRRSKGIMAALSSC
jgi:hypothetical protein